jgi:8-oxo-dGTP diphosphatase
MSGFWRAPRSSVSDAAWRVVFRLGFPFVRAWWLLTRPEHEGTLVAVYVGAALLLLRSSYRTTWNFPGGSVRQGESPEAAARREMREEIGLTAATLVPAGVASGIWDGRHDRVHFFELRLDHMPEMRLDNREIIGAKLTLPHELQTMALTGPVAAYLRPRLPSKSRC